MAKIHITIETDSEYIHLKAFGSRPVQVKTRADMQKISEGNFIVKL